MECPDVQALRSAFLDGELDPGRASALRGHLRECERCREEVEDEAAIVRAAGDLERPDPPPEHWDRLWSGIQARVAEEERVDAHRPRWWLWWQAWRQRMAVSLAALAAGGAALVGVHLTSGPEPTGDPEVRARAPVEPARLLAQAEHQIAEADRRYLHTIRELRDIVARERAHWSAERAAAFDARLDAIARRARRERRELAGATTPDPHERDPLYAAYRAEIRLLQRAAVGRFPDEGAR